MNWAQCGENERRPRGWIYARAGNSAVARALSVARLALLVAPLIAVAGCANLPRTPVPIDRMTSAEVTGMSGVRAIGLEQSEEFQADLVRSFGDETREAVCDERDGAPVYCVLVLSGGGGFGAFGAGLLNGLTAGGTRPGFKIVTGISTGALIAPFAFLGSDYDDELKKAFTTISNKDIFEARGLLSILNNESLADSAPLARLIANYMDENFVAAIAREHVRGRRFYVGTTNMDSQRFVAWNMGAIANSGHPRALELFHRVILASASIPGAFPPVFIDVDVDGARYDEMHSDGGVQTQFFFPGDVVELRATRIKAQAGPMAAASSFRMFVVRNAKFEAVPEQVKRNVGDIASRAVSSMIQSMGVADLYRLYAVANVRGIDFNYAEVPVDFVWQAEEEFDRAEMNPLYEVGYKMAREGKAWHGTRSHLAPSPRTCNAQNSLGSTRTR